MSDTNEAASSAVEHITRLDGGWTRRLIRRTSGKTKGRWDAYLISPQGKTLRSNQELIKYITENRIDIDPAKINFDKALVKDNGSRPCRNVRLLRDVLRRMNTAGNKHMGTITLTPIDEGQLNEAEDDDSEEDENTDDTPKKEKEILRLLQKIESLRKENRNLHLKNEEYQKERRSLKVAAEKSLCTVCYNKSIHSVLQPCRHAFCEDCTPKLERCGLCRATILDTDIIYLC